MKPEISIIVPFYNINSLLLKRCLDSVLRQSFTNFEIIVVNDGSNKDYLDVQSEYTKKDTRVVFINNEHGGVSKARNTGIELAKGKYIAFVDADDFIEESYLNLLYKGIQDCDLVIAGVLIQNFPTVNSLEDRKLFFSQPSIYRGLQYINFCWNKLYKTQIIKDNNIKFDENIKLGEDALFLYEYFKYCTSIRSIKDAVYNYEKNNNSAVNKYDENFWNYEQNVIQKQWDLFHQYPLSESEEQVMLFYLYRKFKLAFYYYIDREPNKQKKKIMIKNIISHPLFKKMKEMKSNKYLNSNDSKIIKIWRYFGINGIYITRFLAKHKNWRVWRVL